ncbi:SDR family NAD(P)-dependent oxidoreductase [Sinomonas terrae]|uniref:SDR family NAD(P)-dependent oxidoreductase n=1 Tax=Sinomonas terrae TaxID=2908838 RepID=A0ABS9U4X6_9MICC|nr:SDR family NAD(P)-dependent oxidoreductase [Sinomonas terrae]MCH6471572.1 SDR family NAD(P)-dependent oxidoreductase [Sinomonas terrae]
MPYAGSQVDGHVVVTGGGTGIGAAIAHRYASEGANVVILGRRPGPLEAVAKDIGAVALVADAGNAEAVKAALAGILRRFGRVDTLVCNAGGAGFAPVGETSDTEWGDSLHANLTTSFVTAAAGQARLTLDMYNLADVQRRHRGRSSVDEVMRRYLARQISGIEAPRQEGEAEFAASAGRLADFVDEHGRAPDW